MPAGIRVADLVFGKRLEIRNAEQRLVVDRKKLSAYVPPPGDMRARYRDGFVYLLLGAKQLQMTTPVAAKVGFALAKNGGACMHLGDYVSLCIDSEEFVLLPEVAVQLGGVLLKKADRADDWQRANPIRRVAK